MCIQRKHSVYKWSSDTPCTAPPTVPPHRAAHSQWAGHKSVLGLLSSALLGPGLVSPSHRVGVVPAEHQTAGMRRMGQHLTNHCTHTEIYAYIYPYVYSTSTHKDTSISQYTLHIYAHTHLSIRRHGNDVDLLIRNVSDSKWQSPSNVLVALAKQWWWRVTIEGYELAYFKVVNTAAAQIHRVLSWSSWSVVTLAKTITNESDILATCYLRLIRLCLFWLVLLTRITMSLPSHSGLYLMLASR